MKKTGEILKRAREQKALSLNEIGLATKINTKILKAIEEGNIEGLPAKTFLRGFVKSYAQYLKLNVDEVLDCFQEEMGPTNALNEKLVPFSPIGEVTDGAEAGATGSTRVAPGKRKVTNEKPMLQQIISWGGIAIVIIGLSVFFKKTVDKYERESDVTKIVVVEKPIEESGSDDKKNLANPKPSTSVISADPMSSNNPSVSNSMLQNSGALKSASIAQDGVTGTPSSVAPRVVEGGVIVAPKANDIKGSESTAGGSAIVEKEKKPSDSSLDSESGVRVLGKESNLVTSVGSLKPNEKKAEEKAEGLAKIDEARILGDKNPDKNSEKKLDKNGEKSGAEKVADKNSDKLTEKSSEKTIEKIVDRGLEKLTEKSDKAVEKLNEKSNEKSLDAKVAEKLVEKPNEKPVAEKSKNIEVIVQALDGVEIEFATRTGVFSPISLNADQFHTFKSKNGLRLNISNGGAVNLFVNGKEAGVPGDLGKPIKLNY